jgi:ATP-dependent Clp protease adaptor protein ClpS
MRQKPPEQAVLSRIGATLQQGGQIAGLECRGRGHYDGICPRAGTAKGPTVQNAAYLGHTMTIIANKTVLAQLKSAAVLARDGAPRMADDDRKRKGEPGGPGTAVITKTKPQTKRPNMYRVLILNDDYTPMEFVVHILERFFGKDHEAATRIMLHVHHHGIGECGVYTYEVAETKVTQVMDFARKHQHPLQCVMEKK